jgi:guanosine-3',5'-bis(diphosphate) 3'-pyrophosphohydrolase
MVTTEVGLNPIIALARAYHFAARKHVNQRRKGEASEPYMNHLTDVAELVAKGTQGSDIDLLVAAVLHDTVEDTDTTFEELSNAFGKRVADLVAEVTDNNALPKATRKLLQIEHAAHASPAAKTIKLADKTANLRALAASPPADWTDERRQEYVAWAREVVAGCRGVNLWLEAEFDRAAAAI